MQINVQNPTKVVEFFVLLPGFSFCVTSNNNTFQSRFIVLKIHKLDGAGENIKLTSFQFL